MSAPVVLGHAGHWLIEAAIYLGPAIVILGLLKLGDRRHARREGADDEDAGTPPDG